MDDLEVGEDVAENGHVPQPCADHVAEDAECTAAQCSFVVGRQRWNLAADHFVDRGRRQCVETDAGTCTCKSGRCKNR